MGVACIKTSELDTPRWWTPLQHAARLPRDRCEDCRCLPDCIPREALHPIEQSFDDRTSPTITAETFRTGCQTSAIHLDALGPV
jgi:hypothetical protein